MSFKNRVRDALFLHSHLYYEPLHREVHQGVYDSTVRAGLIIFAKPNIPTVLNEP